MITDIGSSFYISINTPMGAEIIEKYTNSIEVSNEDKDKFEKLMKGRKDEFEMKFTTDVSNLPLLFKNADNDPVWDELNDRCLGYEIKYDIRRDVSSMGCMYIKGFCSCSHGRKFQIYKKPKAEKQV